MTPTTALDKPSRRSRPRRDLASGKAEPRGVLVRFVVGPDRAVVPNIGRRLPGRGLWLSPKRDVLKMAAAGRGRVFARAAGGPVTVPQELDRLVERLLVERTTNLIGLARRGGTAVGGFERVREFLGGVKPSKDGRAILFVASDAQGSDRKRLASSEVEIAVSEALTAGELGYAFGRDTLVFAAIAPGALAREIEAEASRLSLLRTGEASPDSSDDGVKDASVR